MASKSKPKGKAKPRKKPSKNHFVLGHSGTLTQVGSLQGVTVDKYELNESPIKLVGEQRQYSGKVAGDKLPVYIDDRGVYFVPDCGDQGFAITLETFDAMVKAVAEARKQSK